MALLFQWIFVLMCASRTASKAGRNLQSGVPAGGWQNVTTHTTKSPLQPTRTSFHPTSQSFMTYASSHPLDSTSFAAEIASSGRSDVEGESTSRHSVPLDSIGRDESTVTLPHGNSVDPSSSVSEMTSAYERSSSSLSAPSVKHLFSRLRMTSHLITAPQPSELSAIVISYHAPSTAFEPSFLQPTPTSVSNSNVSTLLSPPSSPADRSSHIAVWDEPVITTTKSYSYSATRQVATITGGPENSSAVGGKTSIQDGVPASPSRPGSELQIQAPTRPSTSKGPEPTMLLETTTAPTTNSTYQLSSVASPSSIVTTSLLSDSTSGDSRPASSASSHHQQATLSETEASVSPSGSVSGVRPQPTMETTSGFPTSTSVDISKLRNNGSLSPAEAGRLTGVVGGVVVGTTGGMAVLVIVLRKIQKRKQREVPATNSPEREVSGWF